MNNLLKTMVCPTPDEDGKFWGVVRAFPSIWKGKVLDVGCRSRRLKEILIKARYEITYYGLDIYPPSDVVGDLGKGLPFEDRTFDVVVALDVLEHLDDIYFGFSELCRVSKGWIIITLPNIYEFRARIRFLLGRRTSGKYGLPVVPPKDRHRWVFSLEEARRFCNYRASTHKFAVKEEGCLIGPRRLRWLKVFVRYLPNLLCPTYLCLLSRRD